MAKMVTVLIVKDTEPVNAVCLSSDNVAAWLSGYGGLAVVPNPEDDFGTEFVTLTGCLAVDVTGLDPMPGVGTGWSYVDGAWVPPVLPEPVEPEGV
jgi:hypothetical protein